MRAALVHDYLNQWGGAENVLLALSELFPEAPIYTLLYDEEKTYGRFKGRVRKTSWLDFPLVRRNHRAFLPLMPFAAQSLRVEPEYDLIISSSAGYAKGIGYSKKAVHISYCHTPLRYAWEQERYLSTLLSKWKFLAAKPLLNFLRRWDYQAGQKPDFLIANSGFIAKRIKNCYGRDSKIIYPPVDLLIFHPDFSEISGQKNYFLAIGRLLHYKRFDLIIDAWKKIDLPLKIVGAGPELEKLKMLAGSNSRIEFLPFERNIEKLRKLYSGARALIFPQVEDFGLVAAEAIACGTPVIAYNEGGAREIVNGNCGILFDAQTPESLREAVKTFIAQEKKFKPEILHNEAKKFSKEKFLKEIMTVVRQLVTNKDK